MKKIKLVLISSILSVYCLGQNLEIEQNNPITTTIPFIIIEPNAQANGLAGIGVVSAKDYYQTGLTQNPALLSKNQKISGVNLSYHQMFSTAKMMNLGGCYSVNNKNTIGATFDYFVIGDLLGEKAAYELYTGLDYAHSFNENLSLGGGIKYIYSNLTAGQNVGNVQINPGKVVAGDIGLDYRKDIKFGEAKNLRYDFGFSVLNVGNKMKYSDGYDGDFIPAIMKIGTLWTFSKKFSDNFTNEIDFAYQAEKLLVPTPPIYDTSGTILKGQSTDVSVLRGITQSFSDAPFGYKEELHEIAHIFGIEERLKLENTTTLAFRVGYFYENKFKGDRKVLSFGFGAAYKSFSVDFSYMKFNINTVHNNNAHWQTITLGYRFNSKTLL